MKLKPALIAFEGTECAGKTTAIQRLKEWIETTYGQEVVVTRAPGGTPVGMKIRHIVTGDAHSEISPSVNAMLFAADWRNTIEQVILPALERGAIVLTDRCNLTCWIYQYQAPEIGKLLEFNNKVKSCDTTFILTTPFDVFVKRRDSRDASLNNARDYIEQEVHDGMVERYMQYADTHTRDAVLVDCLQSIDDISKDIIRTVKDRYGSI